jgi:hypothetical protein
LILALQINTAAQRVTITPPEVGKSITLTLQPEPHSADNYYSIEINAGGRIFHFTPKAPIAKIPTTESERVSRGLWDTVPGLHLDSSRFFFRGEYISDSQRHTLLFFVSEAGASDASPLLVLGFSSAGEPYKVLEATTLDLTAFIGSSDSTPSIVGKATLSQIMGGNGGNGSKAPYATTYDPYSVYIVRVDGAAGYSLAASRSYNQQHYVWAGPHSREDYAVFYNLPGHTKPFGAPATRLNKLLGDAAIPNLK